MWRAQAPKAEGTGLRCPGGTVCGRRPHAHGAARGARCEPPQRGLGEGGKMRTYIWG